MVEWKRLDEVFDLRNGYTPSKSHPENWDGGTIPWFRMEDIRQNGNILTDSIQHITPLGIKKSGLFPANTIIVATTATIGEHALLIADSLANQRFTALTRRKSLMQSVVTRFAYYYCFLLDEWCKQHINVSGFASVDMEGFKQFPFPIPSLSEQNRIVGILDTFTDSIENLKQQIAQRRKQYEFYRDQLLDLEGKEGVEMKSLIDVLEQPITDGPHESPKFYDEGIPFISADAIVNNKIDFKRKRGYISEEYDLQCRKKYEPQLHDIYMVKSGSTTGKVAIVKTDKRFNIWSPLAAIRVNSKNDPMFIFYSLQIKNIQDQVKLKCSKGSQPNLSMRVLEKFSLPIPSLSEQQRIVSILDTFEASISNLEAQLAQRQKQYEYYRNKLLTFE